MVTATTTSRRSLMKGAAWAAPVVIASAAVPAYAASQCVATPELNVNTYFDYGNSQQMPDGTYQSQLTTMYWYIDRAIFSVNGLAPNETITSINVKLQVETLDPNEENNDAPGGFYDPTVYGEPANYQDPGDGWSFEGFDGSSDQTVTVNDLTYQGPLWSANFSSGGEGTYTDVAGGCRNFTSSGIVTPGTYFADEYYDVFSLATKGGRYVPNQIWTVEMQTSEGRTFTVKAIIANQGELVSIERNES